MSDVEARIKQVICDVLQLREGEFDPPYTNESTFIELHADSLDKVELVMGLEEEFNIEIKDSDAEQIQTVRQAIDYIKSRL